MCFQAWKDYAKGILILALLWPVALVQTVFFVMQVYLTTVWKLSFTHAAGIMNVWEGVSLVSPAAFSLVADELLGNFKVVVISGITSTLGIALVTLSVPRMLANTGGMCSKPEGECVDEAQRAPFYIGMVLSALGRGGLSASAHALHDEQSSGVNKMISFLVKFIFYYDRIFLYGIGYLMVAIFVKKWILLFGIPAIYSAYMFLWFACGWRGYNKLKPKGSPITSICRVLVAAKCQSSSSNQAIYRNETPSDLSRPRCLDKAMIGAQGNRGKSITIQDVKAAKFVVRMVPISITMIICGIVSSIGNTYFVEQANNMNKKLGTWDIPLLVFQLPVYYSKSIQDILLWLMYKGRKRIQDPYLIHGLPLAGIGSAMLYSILCCVTAASIETRRLKLVRSGDPRMHVGWLLFQYFLLGGLDTFLKGSVEELYKDQALRDVGKYSPYENKEMEKFLEMASNLVYGLGYICSVLSVYLVGKVSETGGRTNWFQHTLNMSRLDRYYWFLAGLSGLNLIVYLLIIKFYEYKKPEKSEEEEEGPTTC